MNYYQILNVKQNATQEEIKNAYKSLVKKYHPDVYAGDKYVAEKKIKEINVAYEVLSNPETRKEYDNELNPPITYTVQNFTATSKYSYDNYKRNNIYKDDYYKYSNKDYYNDYYSNRNTNDFSDKIVNSMDKLSFSNKLKVIGILLIIYIIILIFSFIQIKTVFNTNTTKNNNTPSITIPKDDSKNFENSKFDINKYYTDEELHQLYDYYFSDYYSSFDEFKEAISEYLSSYYTY